MRYLSVCSGIEAATVAWHQMGWQPVGFSEIENFPSAVLKHHYPNTPNLGDMTKYKEWNIEHPDLLVGGTPCQSFSVAGLRKGLEDPRGNLALVYCGILDHFRPRWFVWENVPGVLSSAGGRDFGSFLGALAQLGYGFAYRVLDAQWFGVAQRRRRVFVVGHLGDWRPAAAVLFERYSLSGHLAPSREKRQGVAASTRTGAANSNWPAEISSTLDTTFGTKQGLEDQHVNSGCPMFVPSTVQTLRTRRPGEGGMSADHEHLVPVISPSLNTCSGSHHAPDTKAYVVQPAYGIPGNWIGRKPENGGNATEPMHDIAPCLTKADQHGVAQPIAVCLGGQHPNAGIGIDQSPTLTEAMGAGGGHVPITNAMAVRRLTPTECERLQGFPDSYTDIKSKNKPTPDGPRYKALGNSMAVPVMAWIGQRIEQVEAICKQNK